MDKNGQKQWGIETINDSRQKKGKFWYHIVWRDGEEQTWEPLKNVINAYASRRLFHIKAIKEGFSRCKITIEESEWGTKGDFI